MAYIIPIIILSGLLLIFIIAITILFASGVFQFRKGTAPSKPNLIPPSDPVTTRPSHDHLINRTFECEIFILDQANIAYNDPTSIEYDQASLIIRNAVSLTAYTSYFSV
jgi:hypothetical protein